jgi:hypothetical protein
VLCTCFDLPHPIVEYFSCYQCGHIIDDLGIHFLKCLCGNECIVTQDNLWDTIVTVALENGTHVQKKVSHFFPLPNLMPINILIIRYDF